MPSALAIAGLVALVGAHTVVAAVLTRFFRVRLETRWAPPLYVLAVVPVVLFVSTLVASGVLGLGPDLGGPGRALFVTIGAPIVLGAAVDYLWMPAPEEVELPEAAD